VRFGFAASAPFGADVLERLAANHEIAFCLTLPDAPAGRGRGLRPTQAKLTALKLGIPVVESLEQTLDESTIVLVAYGRLIPRELLERHLWLNLHPSLLPRWRGAAPIHRAVMAGDAGSGVTVMKMDEGLDTGRMAYKILVPVGPNMTTGELHDSLAQVGAALMARAMDKLEHSRLRYTPQPEAGVTYAAKIDQTETRVDWARPANEVHNHIRGLSPFPGAWCEIGGARVKLLHSVMGEGSGAPGTVLDEHLTIACGRGSVRILELQKAGARPMRTEEFLRGAVVAGGLRLA
jgi:methionyl-tRNA formyltransferase